MDLINQRRTAAAIESIEKGGLRRHETAVLLLPLHGRWWRAREETATKARALYRWRGSE